MRADDSPLLAEEASRAGLKTGGPGGGGTRQVEPRLPL